VLSFWPGYLLETAVPPYPGTENNFGIAIAGQLSASEKKSYHVISNADISESFLQNRPELVIVHKRQSQKALHQALIEGAYQLLESLDAVQIYMRPPLPLRMEPPNGS
jgi:hypothetical protein